MADDKQKEYNDNGQEILDKGDKWSTGEKILGALLGPGAALLMGGKMPTMFDGLLGLNSKYKREPKYGPMPTTTGGMSDPVAKPPGMAKGGKVGRPKMLKGNMGMMDMKAPVKKPMKAKAMKAKAMKPMKMAKGGSVKAGRGDGCCMRGKTKGRMM